MEQLRIMIYGDFDQHRSLAALLKESAYLTQRNWTVRTTDDFEDLRQQLVEWDPRLTIVAAQGADGFEAAYQARSSRPCNPVFWFSDDRNFALQAHRMECMYFSTTPVTAEKLDRAFDKCCRLGHRL